MTWIGIRGRFDRLLSLTTATIGSSQPANPLQTAVPLMINISTLQEKLKVLDCALTVINLEGHKIQTRYATIERDDERNCWRKVERNSNQEWTAQNGDMTSEDDDSLLVLLRAQGLQSAVRSQLPILDEGLCPDQSKEVFLTVARYTQEQVERFLKCHSSSLGEEFRTMLEDIATLETTIQIQAETSRKRVVRIWQPPSEESLLEGSGLFFPAEAEQAPQT